MSVRRARVMATYMQRRSSESERPASCGFQKGASRNRAIFHFPSSPSCTRGMPRSAPSEPAQSTRKTWSNSSPLAAWIVITATAPSTWTGASALSPSRSAARRRAAPSIVGKPPRSKARRCCSAFLRLAAVCSARCGSRPIEARSAYRVVSRMAATAPEGGSRRARRRNRAAAAPASRNAEAASGSGGGGKSRPPERRMSAKGVGEPPARFTRTRRSPGSAKNRERSSSTALRSDCGRARKRQRAARSRSSGVSKKPDPLSWWAGIPSRSTASR